MGKTLVDYLDVDSTIYRCASCRCHLARADAIESKLFQGSSGPAYLFNAVINVTKGPPDDRILTTGVHTVRDIYCAYCDEYVGWFYDRAFEASQRYKEGKWILERQRLSTEPFVSPALTAAAASAQLLRQVSANAATLSLAAAVAAASSGASGGGASATVVSAPSSASASAPASASASPALMSISGGGGGGAAGSGASATSSVASSPAASPALSSAAAGSAPAPRR